MNSSSQSEILQSIRTALEAVRVILSRFTGWRYQTQYKAGHDPVTAADRAGCEVDRVMRKNLL